MVELARLRAAYRETGPVESGHLSDEQWERLACDEMDSAERESVLEHVLSCSECSEVYRGVLAVRMEAHTFDNGAPRPKSSADPARGWRWKGVVTGLAAAAAVIVVFLVVRPSIQPSAVKPGGSETVTLRASGVLAKPVLISPVGEVSGIPGELSWRPVEGARGYLVELLDAKGELLWKSEELAVTGTPWPQVVHAAPGRYYWRVLAVPEGGGKAVASHLESFEIGISASRP